MLPQPQVRTAVLLPLLQQLLLLQVQVRCTEHTARAVPDPSVLGGAATSSCLWRAAAAAAAA